MPEADHENLRNPHLLSRDTSAVVLIDAQERLFSVIPDRDHVVWKIGKLLRGAQLLGVTVYATEQYPEKLGATASPLAPYLQGPAVAKLRFSMAQCSDIVRQLQAAQVRQLVVAGLETHVCVLQSAMDLLGAGFDVYVPADAVGARHALDHQTALARMHAVGATVITTEMALFEWCEVAGTDSFRAISALVRETPPAASVPQ